MHSKIFYFFFWSVLYIPINLFAQATPSFYPASQSRRISPGKTTYYIDPKHGSDKNNGIDQKKPWKTFKRINQLVLSPGDGVEVLTAGPFHETLALMAKGSQSLPVKVKFAPGRYDLFPDNTLKRQIHITNTNDSPFKLKAIALLFDSCRFTQVEGANANFILRGKMIETYINHCTNISLLGLSFDYLRPTVSELKVTDVGSNYAEFQIHPDSKFSIQDSLLTWQGEGWHDQPESYWQVLNPQTNKLMRVIIPMKDARFISLGDQKVRAYFRKSPLFKKGLIYQTRNIERDYSGVFMQHSKNILLKNIRIYFMHGMGVVGQYCENIKLSHVVVKPNELSGRTCAAWADILHFAGCKGLVEIGNSYLSAANDDAINVHGIHLQIIKIERPDQIRVKFEHDQTYGFNPYSAGDSLDFIHPQTLLPIGSNLILKSMMLNDKEVLLTLKNPIPTIVSTDDVVENTTATPRVWIHDNQITRIPTRGILTTTRRKIVIERNDIHDTHMSGILVNDDAAYWFESGMVRNLMISKNNIARCGEPVIDIHPENTETNKKPVHSNISVINNTFELEGLRLFAAKSTSDIKIKDNTVKLQKTVHQFNELVELKNCTQIDIAGNKIIYTPLK